MSLRNLFGALGLESTLQSILARMADGLQKSTVSTLGMDKVLVGSARDKMRDEFLNFDTTDATGRWDVFTGDSSGTYTNQNSVVGKLTGQNPSVTLPNGTTIALGGVAAGSRYLAIGAGLTNGAEIVVQSKDSFTLPLKVAAGITISQKVNNQNLHFEIVSVDDTGAVEYDSTLPTAAWYMNVLNALGYRWYGTNNTSSDKYVRGMGCPELVSTNVATNTIVAGGTSPNFTCPSAFELLADMEQAEIVDRNTDSVATAQALTKRTQDLPDPGKRYKMRFRIQNTAAQTLSTIMRLHFARVLDTTRITVDLARHFGKVDASTAIPVQTTGNVTLNGFSTTAIEAMRTARFTQTSSSVLAAGASFTTGADQLVGWTNSSDSHQRYGVDIANATDVTVQRQISPDGSTWRNCGAPISVPAGQGLNMTWISPSRWNRVIVTNGSTAMDSGAPLYVFTSRMMI